jgi:uncharacterized protein YxjI
MREGYGGIRQDTFNVSDANGTTYFQLNPKLFSLSQKRTLLDAYGQPCILLEQKLASLHGSWIMKNGYSGAKVAEIKPSIMSLSPSVKVIP